MYLVTDLMYGIIEFEFIAYLLRLIFDISLIVELDLPVAVGGTR
jgi:hypothetical protein